MRWGVTAILLSSLAAPGAAQSGAEITMPANSRQTAQFAFVNSCPTRQTFRITAEPPAEWLRFDPTSVDVERDRSFEVRVTVSTFVTRKPAVYRSKLRSVCASCAAGDPPCFQEATEFPIGLTIDNTRTTPGQFEPVAAPGDDPQPAQPDRAPMPPLIRPQSVRPRKLDFPIAVAGLLAAGVAGIAVAARGLLSIRRAQGMAGGKQG